jgi:anti-sigma regulatory factor (Ser/Thr protein kinase)
VSATGLTERFSIELSPEPAYLATARMFAAAVARQVSVEEELLDDLKLAISEACARALVSAPDGPLRVAAIRTGGRLVFEVTQGERALPGGPGGEDLAAGLSLELITVLFDDAEVAPGPDGTPVVRFSLPAP